MKNIFLSIIVILLVFTSCANETKSDNKIVDEPIKLTENKKTSAHPVLEKLNFDSKNNEVLNQKITINNEEVKRVVTINFIEKTNSGKAAASVITVDTYKNGEVKTENRTYRAPLSAIKKHLEEIRSK